MKVDYLYQITVEDLTATVNYEDTQTALNGQASGTNPPDVDSATREDLKG